MNEAKTVFLVCFPLIFVFLMNFEYDNYKVQLSITPTKLTDQELKQLQSQTINHLSSSEHIDTFPNYITHEIWLPLMDSPHFSTSKSEWSMLEYLSKVMR